MSERIGKYLKVERRPNLLFGKPCWDLITNQNDSLGWLNWYAGWKQFVFNPEPYTEYNSECLADIKAFLDRVNAEEK